MIDIIEEGPPAESQEEVMFVGSCSSNTNVPPEGFIADSQTRLSQTKNGSIRMHSSYIFTAPYESCVDRCQ